MCGIAGLISTEPNLSCDQLTRSMINVQRHRGPDGEGFWSGRVGSAAVSFGHLRLAIIDLTEGGHQPMFLPDGTQGLIFNGEIYNYKEIRTELRQLSVSFQTQSDTEVLLWALATWGGTAFARFNGMWALAWIDIPNQKLVLSRDRFGIKPLYLYQRKGTLFFASEIKAILEVSGDRFPINTQCVGRFLHQSLLDAVPETFFCGINALPAGSLLELNLAPGNHYKPKLTRYWEPALSNGFKTLEDGIDAVRSTFFDAVQLRLRSDVPVGILLSGGMDSSAIAAGMRRALGRDADLHAISAISARPEYDETPFIDTVSRHLACPVHYVRLNYNPTEWFDLLSSVVYANDEPVGSFSPVAHYLLMQEAKKLDITVILSGQGGDENLCGYFKFLIFYLQQLSRERRWLNAANVLSGFLRNGTVFSQFKISEAKRYLPSAARNTEINIYGSRLKQQQFAVSTGLGPGTLVDRQRLDLDSLSVPSLVHYEDRTSMSFSREIRLPFLDYRFVQLLLSLGPEWKLRQGWTKWVFRKAVENELPASIVWRKDKQGFTIPQAEWLKHDLRGKIEGMLNNGLLSDELGLINREGLTRRYQAYCKQPANRGLISFKDIFNPIALEIWLRRFEGNLCPH